MLDPKTTFFKPSNVGIALFLLLATQGGNVCLEYKILSYPIQWFKDYHIYPKHTSYDVFNLEFLRNDLNTFFYKAGIKCICRTGLKIIEIKILMGFLEILLVRCYTSGPLKS